MTHAIVHQSIGSSAVFFTLNIWMILCVRERLTRIKERFPITNVINAHVLTTISDCPVFVNIRCTIKVIAKTNNHCSILNSNVFLPKSDSLGSRGKRDIIFASSFSHSNITEHAGSIINSMKTTCIG